MTYTVSSATLNSTTPYHTIDGVTANYTTMHVQYSNGITV